MRVIAVIPARMGSLRLPGKPLSIINGKPMIQWVYENSKKAKSVHQVIVATDDERVIEAVSSFGGEAMLTSRNIQSGTDRVAEIAKKIEGDVFVNVQGDEPMMQGSGIDAAVKLLVHSDFSLTTIATPLHTQEELLNPNVVKVILDENKEAIYFSRHPIPYSRQPAPLAGESYLSYRHLGLYVYRKESLLKFSGSPPSLLEKAESLEQLRALVHGLTIGCEIVDFKSIGVDTEEDLNLVRGEMK